MLKIISEPNKIILIMGKRQLSLNKQESVYFLRELQSKNIGLQHTHPVEEFNIKLVIVMKDKTITYFNINPDAINVNEYWVNTDWRLGIKRIKSVWFDAFFKNVGFFDHQDILEN